jgi:hypothetical protein
MQRLWIHLKLFYRKNKAVFLLLLAIQMMIACSMHYTFLKNQVSRYEADDYDRDLKTFEIIKDDGWSLEELQWTFESLPFSAETAWVYNSNYNVKAYTIGEEAALQKVAGHFESGQISYSDWQEGDYMLQSVVNLYKKTPGDTFKVNNIPLTVLGRCDSHLEKYSIVPLQVFQEASLKVDAVYLTSQASMNISEVELLHSDLQVLYPGAEIDDPIKRNYTFEELYEDKDILSFIMLLLAIFTEGYLLLYLRQKHTEEYEVFRILGTTGIQNQLYHTLSCVMVLMVQSLMGRCCFCTFCCR